MEKSKAARSKRRRVRTFHSNEKVKKPRRKTRCCGVACATACGSEVALCAWSFLSRLKAATPLLCD